ncbi:hypothetical protein M434DRAFT_207875 [Hypoxylon sp. CO27-5]|nr:hypothetical protein M434DRAFT_207875 [Hypoxylon sp. CO27-5]
MMPLSNEAVIGLVALLFMCVPGGRFLLRFIWKRWVTYKSRLANRDALLPVANQPVPHLYNTNLNASPLRRDRFIFGRPSPVQNDDGTFLLNEIPSHYERIDVRETNMSWSATRFS